MPKYTGKLELKFWVEATNPQEVDTIIWETLDGLEATSPKRIVWDDADWKQYEEEGNDN